MCFSWNTPLSTSLMVLFSPRPPIARIRPVMMGRLLVILLSVAVTSLSRSMMALNQSFTKMFTKQSRILAGLPPSARFLKLTKDWL